MPRKRKDLTEWDITLMAWHEAGHAVCSYFLPETEPIQSISIEPGNEAYGMMRSVPRVKMNLTYVSCLNEISVALAGRLSEEMFLNEVTSSCIHDLDKVQAIALRMVSEMGMGKRTGKISWMCHDKDSNALMLFSDMQRDEIYADIKEILSEAENTELDILKRHQEHVEKLAKALLKQKTIKGSALSTILAISKTPIRTRQKHRSPPQKHIRIAISQPLNCKSDA